MSAESIALVMLKRHEGYRQKPYQCTAGKWTIGYGTNLEAAGYTDQEIRKLDVIGWSQSEAETKLIWDIRTVVSALEKLPLWAGLDDARRAVLIDMAYNLGIGGLLKFKKLLAAVEQRDWQAAVFEMLNSKWAKELPTRSAELRNVMKAGVID